MSRKTRLTGTVLGWTLVLCGFAAVAWERSTGAEKQPPPPATEQTIPESPKQNEAWKPPASKVPDEFVKAVTLLFEQGLSDPRGCEYRVIELLDSSRTHGWVLPAREGEKQRYAICWDGLVQPVASIGDKADLKKDIPARGEQVEKGRGRLIQNDNLATVLLLRLGEGELASNLWAANHPSPTAGDKAPMPKGPDPYLGLAQDWARVLLGWGLDAHNRGDDALALHAFRKLTKYASAVEDVAKKHGFEPIKEDERYLKILWQLSDLLADQERRATEGKREAIVCVGPDRDPDQKKRVAALVLRLDEVGGCSSFTFGDDPIVRALIREGSPAVEPLLKCLEDDGRLTRAVRYPFPPRDEFYCKSVRLAAYLALVAILDYTPHTTGEEKPKELAALFRAHLEKTKGLTPAERWFRELADDNAEPRDLCWYNAAKKLLAPDPATPQVTVWTSRSASPSQPSGKKPKLLGESLRGKKAPSVTELLLKRIEQSEASDAADLALLLSVWEPKAALEPLAELTKRLRQKDKNEQFVELVEKRHELGDRKALDEYVAFVRTAHPKMLSGWRSNLFKPMIDHPDHPEMAKAAEELFADEKSPWLPLLQKNDNRNEKKKPDEVHELIPTRLLQLPAFRNAVLKELGDKKKIGEVRLTKEGELEIKSPFGIYRKGGGNLPPKEDVKQEFRACDWCAYMIGDEIKCAPRCELYWTEAERDKAVTACMDFLRRQQYELEWRKETFRLDAPATAAQVENGQAVFSLLGEGKQVRVVPGFNVPVSARWLTCKDKPYRVNVFDPRTEKTVVEIQYEREGKVVQAEEVLQDGRWRRYYGFLGLNHLARVPAEEIDFSPDEPEWSGAPHWVIVGADLHARLDVPPVEIGAFDDPSSFYGIVKHTPRLPADAGLKFAVVVRNARGLEQPSPDAHQCVRVRLLYSPEVVSPQGALVPQAKRETDWVELKTKPGAKFAAEKGQTLAAAEERKLATFDLREWFDMSKPGFYRLQLLPTATEKDANKDAIGEIRFSLAK